MKWRSIQEYCVIIEIPMLYGTECWDVKKQHIHKMSIFEMRILRKIRGNIRKDRIQNEETPIDEKMRVNHWRIRLRLGCCCCCSYHAL